MSTPTTEKKRKLSLPLVIAGGVSSLVLALGMSPTFSSFSAAIFNSTNTAAAGTLTMQEATTSGTAATCDSGLGTATCSTINKFGGNGAMYPGQTVTTSITITNTGSVPATSFSLATAACAASDVAGATVHGTGNPCNVMTVVVKSGSTNVFTSNTLTAFGSAGTIILPAPVAPGASVPFTFEVTLPLSADNTMQGRQASVPMTWTFGA